MMTAIGSMLSVAEGRIGQRGFAAAIPSRKRVGAVAEQGGSTQPAPDNAFARLTQLVQSNDRLLAELAVLDARLVETEVYLAMASSNLDLARAYRVRTKRQRSRVLAILRANRIAAREFLSQ